MAPSAVPSRSTRVPDMRAGDQVVVLTGKDAGKRGVIQHVVRQPQGWRRRPHGSGPAGRRARRWPAPPSSSRA